MSRRVAALRPNGHSLGVVLSLRRQGKSRAIGQTRHRPATSIPTWLELASLRVGLGLAGKIAVAISDPTWPLETCLRYPL